MGKLGCHPEGGLPVVPEVLRGGDGHTALAHMEVQQLVDLRAVLEQDVLPGHAEVCRAPLHIDGNVRGLDPEVADAGGLILKHKPAARVLERRAVKAGSREHGIDPVAQAALRQGNINHFLQCAPLPSR